LTLRLFHCSTGHTNGNVGDIVYIVKCEQDVRNHGKARLVTTINWSWCPSLWWFCGTSLAYWWCSTEVRSDGTHDPDGVYFSIENVLEG